MYIAYELTNKSRNAILEIFKPKFSEVICHHITYKFGVNTNQPLPNKPNKIEVIGYSADEGIECLVVRIDGEKQRLDGKLYHITLSLDRSKGKKPVDSNNLLIEKGWRPIPIFEIEASPKLLK